MTAKIGEENRAIWILGLNHSGTTIVWSAFRKDGRFLCFDEPLTFDLGACFPKNNIKQTFDEYIKYFGGDPAAFWGIYASIDPLQELDNTFTAEQERYLNILLMQAENIVLDETHVHLHCPSISKVFPGGYVIHLYRRASSFVTSHLRPNWSRSGGVHRQAVRWFRYEYDKRTFWSRSDYPPGMRRGDVIGGHPQSKFGLLLADAGYDAGRIMSAPALVRLLAYWHYHYHYLEREGPKLFGKRFMSLRYEDFASRPRETMNGIYRWLDMSLPVSLDYADVHLPKPPHLANDRRWREAAKLAGFSGEEIETLL